MIAHPELTFLAEQDPIKTERVVFEHFSSKSYGNLPEYVALPIAYSINHFGINKTQKLINDINSWNVEKKIFVCQHISVSRLSFGNNYVFTPHTVHGDKFLFMPHYNPLDADPNFSKDKKYLCSFIGDFGTNSVRRKLAKLNSERSLIKNTSGWFFKKSAKDQDRLKMEYVEALQNSKFSLCPQGTGPSTLRLFESFSLGSFPVIFNNIKLPKDLEKFVLKANPDNISESWLESFDLGNAKDMFDIYQRNYSNQFLWKSIVNFFEEK